MSLLDSIENPESKPDEATTILGDSAPKRRGRPPGSKNKPKDAFERNPPELAKDIASAWLGLFLVIEAAGWLFGFEKNEELTPEEAEEDARALVPIAIKHPGLLKVLAWIGAPVVIIRRIKQKFKLKPKEPKQPTQTKNKEGNPNAAAVGPKP